MLRRSFDLVFSVMGLVILAPLFALIGTVVWMVDGRPILFRQVRIGKAFRPFTILKFRTMIGESARMTRVGRFLRRTRLDELPQLWNVVRGDMSMVGPRPEVPVFVDAGSELWQHVLRVRPGLVDPATLAFVDEAALLETCADRDAAYRQWVLPQKLQMSHAYLGGRGLLSDFRLLRDALVLVGRRIAGH